MSIWWQCPPPPPLQSRNKPLTSPFQSATLYLLSLGLRGRTAGTTVWTSPGRPPLDFLPPLSKLFRPQVSPCALSGFPHPLVSSVLSPSVTSSSHHRPIAPFPSSPTPISLFSRPPNAVGLVLARLSEEKAVFLREDVRPWG